MKMNLCSPNIDDGRAKRTCTDRRYMKNKFSEKSTVNKEKETSQLRQGQWNQ